MSQQDHQHKHIKNDRYLVDKCHTLHDIDIEINLIRSDIKTLMEDHKTATTINGYFNTTKTFEEMTHLVASDAIFVERHETITQVVTLYHEAPNKDAAKTKYCEAFKALPMIIMHQIKEKELQLNIMQEAKNMTKNAIAKYQEMHKGLDTVLQQLFNEFKLKKEEY